MTTRPGKFSSFLREKLIALLNVRRIVVWYDPGGDFRAFATEILASECEVLLAGDSVLKARRRADEVYRLMAESETAEERDRRLLIHLPRYRGAGEDEKVRDPFEAYALAGAAFGDHEDQRFQSLARQALPNMIDKIETLFREGKPDIAFLDGLESSRRWPVLNAVFRTETPSEIIAAALCDAGKIDEAAAKPGCAEELLRMLEDSVGFKPVGGARDWTKLRKKAAEFILFSEFAFDLPHGLPDSMANVPRADNHAKTVIEDACDRMRANTGFSDEYAELAQKIEDWLRLPALTPEDTNLGVRDTFPFEERRLLASAAKLFVAGDRAAAKSLVETRKRSFWRMDPERAPAWTAIERADAVAESAALVLERLKSGKIGLGGLMAAYTGAEGGWWELDRASRLFEKAFASCDEEEAVAPVADLCRWRYRDAADALQDSFIEAVKNEGWPPEGTPRQTKVFDERIAPLLERRERTAFFMVDSLRYEMGRELSDVLRRDGDVQAGHAAAALPTVTGCGMAALMPGADGALQLIEKGGKGKKGSELVPAIGARRLETSKDRMGLLSHIYGDRFADTTLNNLPRWLKEASEDLGRKDLLVVRVKDPDNLAETSEGRPARQQISDVIDAIAKAVRLVASKGFHLVVISSDHGHMMLPETKAGDVVVPPQGVWLENKRRCRLGVNLATHPGTVVFKAGDVGIQGNFVRFFCQPIRFRVYSDGKGYFHGGLSLQEAVVPVIVFRWDGRGGKPAAGKPRIEVSYRSERFTTRVVSLTILLEDRFETPVLVLVEAYGGSGAKAKVVGKAIDCEAWDEKTGEVTLRPGEATPVPVLLNHDFDGAVIEFRVSDPSTFATWARLKLKNGMLD
jgi:hypothetical protein